MVDQRALGERAFRTADAAALLRVKEAHASKLLAGLSAHGHVFRVKRGLWALAESADALALVPHLTAPLSSYVSLQTALYHHGMISQIPSVVYAVSLSRTGRYATAVAGFSVHHVAPGWFFGYEELGERRIPMAVPERALIHVLYLSPTRSRIFSALPEVELPKRFGIRAARRMVDRIPDARRRGMVHRRLEGLLRSGRRA